MCHLVLGLGRTSKAITSLYATGMSDGLLQVQAVPGRDGVRAKTRPSLKVEVFGLKVVGQNSQTADFGAHWPEQSLSTGLLGHGASPGFNALLPASPAAPASGAPLSPPPSPPPPWPELPPVFPAPAPAEPALDVPPLL